MISRDNNMNKHILDLLLRTMSVITGIVLLNVFIAPYMTYGILNIGNETGILLSTMLIVYALFTPHINAFIKKVHKNSFGKVLLYLMLAFMIMVFTLACIATANMIKASHNRPNSETTLIVLGCKVYGDRPSLMLEERIDAAYDYLISHPECKAILSGGKGSDEDISEAKCMYNDLTKRGIASDRLFIEEKSTSTRENISYSLKLIEENNLCPDITIISNEFHLYRATHAAKEAIKENNADGKVTAIGAKTYYILFPTYYLRELWGICYEIVF